ncbi:hypothetical protein [Dapis sp. BLCC M229]|uniref:hypothetical protein n=1 Tax=Dapis sp. BLCC M229 TaxID=3400188 RepID=UPI003CE90B5F
MTPNKSKSESVVPVLGIAALTFIATAVYVGFGVASVVNRSIAVLDVAPENARVEQAGEKLSAWNDSDY